MRSLRNRLLVVLLASLAVAWVGWYAFMRMQMSSQQTGVWDDAIQNIAQQILLSLPGDVAVLGRGEHLKLPSVEAFSGEKLSYQVWSRGDRRLLLRSLLAPTSPLRSDFVDGFAMRTVDGDAWRVYTISDAQGAVQVQVGKRQAQLVAELAQLGRLSLLKALLALLALAGVVWLVIRWSLRPVEAVRRAIVARDALDLSPLSAERLPDEVRPLVESFNRQLGRLDGTLRAERSFIAEVAHELRTPLAALLTHAQLALGSRNPEESKLALELLAKGIERSARLAQQLLDAARLDADKAPSGKETVEMAEVVAVVVREFDALARQRGQAVTVVVEPCSVYGNLDELGILVRNLIDNAVRYSGVSARIEVLCRCERDMPDTVVVLAVADDGPGVPPGERERIFERFYRVNGNHERGSGLGLALVARIAQSHGASVRVGVGLDARGLGVAVRFPCAEAGRLHGSLSPQPGEGAEGD